MASLFSPANPFRRRAHDGGNTVNDSLAPLPKRPKHEQDALVDEGEEEQKLGPGEEEQKLAGEEEQGPSRYDNEEKLQRTIFVGNLPLATKKKALVRQFSCFGPVESARLRSVPVGTMKMPRRSAVITGQLSNNRSSLNGYIVFRDAESANAALAYNMKEFDGKHIRVDIAHTRSQLRESNLSFDKKRSIFVGNLPLDVEDEELYALFSGRVQVEAVRVVRDKETNVGKGFAFVLFKDKAGVEDAFGRGQLEIRNRKLRIQRVRGDGGKPKKRERHTVSSTKDGKVKGYEGARSGTKKWTHPAKVSSLSGQRREIGVKKKRPAVASRKAVQKGLLSSHYEQEQQ